MRFVLSFARAVLPDMRRPGTALFWLYWIALAVIVFAVPAFAQTSGESCYFPSLTVAEFEEIMSKSLAFLAICWLVKTLGGLLRGA